MATHITGPEPTSPGAALGRRTYTVTEAAKLLGISRSTAYECVRSGELRSLRFRSRIVIPESAMAALLALSDHSAACPAIPEAWAGLTTATPIVHAPRICP